MPWCCARLASADILVFSSICLHARDMMRTRKDAIGALVIALGLGLLGATAMIATHLFYASL